MLIIFGFAFFSVLHARQQVNEFGQLFHVKVQPPPAQDRLLRGQHRIDQSVFDFSLLCGDGIPLLMEDHKPRPCQPRPWLPEHKCPTGFWCHEGFADASYYCCPNSRKFANRCHLPPAVGYGKQRMRRFYFDWKTDACHELQYSGIGGNENSFMDYEICEKVCRGAGEPPISLPSNMKILTHEKKVEKPEKEKKLVYPKEVAAVVSLQPPKATPITTDSPATVHEVFYTVSPKKTSTLLSTTTTTVTTTTEEDVLDPNPCVLTPDKGLPGSMAITMWYYDQTSTSCSPFLYLGKGGNSNRFESSESCMDSCGIGKPTRKSCDLPPAIGNGPFNIPRYYFDRVTKKCERFFYSGRDGNDNRFYKKNKCERLCLRKKPKKKENIYEYTTTPSTPMRIIQNLVSHHTTPSTPGTMEMAHTDPYVYATTRMTPITVESWVEKYGEKEIFEYTTTAHPTLIYEPRGETLPTIVPPVITTTPSIVDHVFSSLMNTQQRKLVESVEDVYTETTTNNNQMAGGQSTFGQVEQQPVPMSPYGTGSMKPIENQYGMKVEPYQPTSYVLPQYPQSSVYLPYPPAVPAAQPEVKPITVSPPSNTNIIVNHTNIQPLVTSTTSIPTTQSIPWQPWVAPVEQPNNTFVPLLVKPIPPLVIPSYVTPSWQPTTTIPTTTSTASTTTTTTTTPSPTITPIPTLSPTAGQPLYAIPGMLPFVTSTTPVPTLLPPSNTFVTSTNDSPCRLRLFGDATIMCETRPEICPIGTFCQVGQGQSICCPIMEDPPCEQSIETGIGASLIRRWFFDPATKLCQPFYFKGFKGNQNNFQSYDDCNRACGATMICPSGGSPQLSIHTHLLSCSIDSDCPLSHMCIQSTPHNLCCFRSDPPPPSPSQVDQSLVVDFVPPTAVVSTTNNLCEQPIDIGYGMYSEHRWAFTNGQCNSFIFRGQGGNMNNFLTRNDCVNTCQNPSTSLSASSSQCIQPAASGHGEQYLSRFFYSPEYRQCLHFIYSGEGGNANNFDSLTDCLETCVANGIKFSSLANSPMSPVPPPPTPIPNNFDFTFQPRKMCPKGDPLVTIGGQPIQCDPTKAAKCPGDHVCTPVGQEAYCCPSPMNFCLQSRPAISVCQGPNYEPVREIRFTYDPMADRCIRFSYQNCRGAGAAFNQMAPTSSLNSFSTNSQCNRLCCNQGYNLVYKRRLLMAMNDDPIDE